MVAPSTTLFRTATAQSTFQGSPAGGGGGSGRPPRPAMRISRTASDWATRIDCCMSATLVCTRFSLLLKSNRASTPNNTMTVTNSDTAASTRVKPRWRRLAKREVVCGMALPSERPDQPQGDPLAGPQDASLLGIVDGHLDLLEMDEDGLRGPRQTIGIVEIPVRQGVDAVLPHPRGAVPQGPSPAARIRRRPTLVRVAGLVGVPLGPDVQSLFLS